MEIKGLHSGDILLFSPEEGSWISDAIVFLTGAPVSHAAMSYLNPSDIIEETVPNVRVAPADERFKNRKIYVMRDPRHSDFSPVLNASTGYLNSLEPYGMTNLYLVGMILLYKKFSHTGPRQKAILKILKLTVKKLLPIINEHQYGDKKPMVCSQFVFQCYQDAGKDYELTITDGNLLKSSQSDKNLLDKALQHKSTNVGLMKSSIIDESSINGKEILEQLKITDGQSSPELEVEILDTVHQLATIFHALEQQIDFEQANSQHGLKLLAQQEAMFVTPADLLKHCDELEQAGIIEI